MKTPLIIILFTCSFQIEGQIFEKHYDTLLHRKFIPKTSRYNPDSLLKRHYKEVITHTNYPIRIRSFSKSTNEYKNQKIDTIPFYYYSGEPYKKGLLGCTYINPAVNINFDDDFYLPHSALFYQNPSHIEPDLNTNFLFGTSPSSIELSEFFKPFYIKTGEVTNLEYRQFVNYVRDSITRRILAEEFPKDFLLDFKIEYQGMDYSKFKLNWETEINYWDEEYIPILAEMYLPESERFYQRKEIDTRKLIYEYYDEDSSHQQLNIYPDTLCWIHDFEVYIFESLTNMYFWHPAYDNYPVVGVNWNQTKAYCHWLTKRLQKQHRDKGSTYKIKVNLPSIIQWQTVRVPIISKSYRLADYPNVPQFDWKTDLLLKDSIFSYFDTNSLAQKEIDSLYYLVYINKNNSSEVGVLDGVYFDEGTTNQIYQIRRKNTKYRYDYLQDYLAFPEIWTQVVNYKKYEITYPYLSENQIKKYSKKGNAYNNYIALHNQKHTNEIGIKYLGNNVSEWLLESYNDNWKYIYFKRNELLIKSLGADADVQGLTEEYFNTYNDVDGKLIMGGNWYDQRDGFNFGRNIYGTLPKVFKSPEKSYSTVGFRYVITIEE